MSTGFLFRSLQRTTLRFGQSTAAPVDSGLLKHVTDLLREYYDDVPRRYYTVDLSHQSKRHNSHSKNLLIHFCKAAK